MATTTHSISSPSSSHLILGFFLLLAFFAVIAFGLSGIGGSDGPLTGAAGTGNLGRADVIGKGYGTTCSQLSANDAEVTPCCTVMCKRFGEGGRDENAAACVQGCKAQGSRDLLRR